MIMSGPADEPYVNPHERGPHRAEPRHVFTLLHGCFYWFPLISSAPADLGLCGVHHKDFKEEGDETKKKNGEQRTTLDQTVATLSFFFFVFPFFFNGQVVFYCEGMTGGFSVMK